MQTVLRPFVPSDRDAVNRVAQAAFAQYEHHYQDWPSFNEGIGRMADLSEVAELLVAEVDGDIAGAVVHVGPGSPRSAIFPQEWSVIRMLVVAPGYRGHGVGRQLVAACLRAAMRDGAPAIGLHTSPIMASALRMYTGIGFTRDCDLDPIRGVPYGRYMLPQAGFQAALERLS
ncbi:GNAT family N-acetyltransferase [Massilia sp. 9I]|uniref:GNAT family N-acetyltransferase n=1 Tax=Massilia sp. 9I TaxID=2653152 RepID=UPI0012F435C4|nr:GNAT family N-acetyltransferase [Massilia sp. 9I]VXA99618.1 conserved hypothetical protein [Massilia sp. 9I]